jgi:hypothetical protein
MNESELKVSNSEVGKDQTDWHVDTIAEQTWSEPSGAVTHSTIQEVLTEVVPNYLFGNRPCQTK